MTKRYILLLLFFKFVSLNTYASTSENCTICYNNSNKIQFSCGHSVCEDCNFKVMSTSKKCPFCREDLEETAQQAPSTHNYSDADLLNYFSKIRHGHYEDFIELIETLPINTTDNFGNNAAHIAAQNGRIKMLKQLHSRGIVINKKNNSGKTPLDFATTYRFEKTRRLLIRLQQQ
jgi:ankyrin repeat protein